MKQSDLPVGKAELSASYALDLAPESLAALSQFSDAVDQLITSNSRLIDAEHKLERIEELLLGTDSHAESKKLRWIIDQMARIVFGQNYGAFVVQMNQKSSPWNKGEK